METKLKEGESSSHSPKKRYLALYGKGMLLAAFILTVTYFRLQWKREKNNKMKLEAAELRRMNRNRLTKYCFLSFGSGVLVGTYIGKFLLRSSTKEERSLMKNLQSLE